ncbi:hypothetical protein BDW02DRAFT_271760 [Decorospora gaudefroyi]|uniref:NACHT domain-containing protein n=1 Tax=Decorospora gaudefroyi TaxID=184978 RepID=A0A6A5K1T7_9PLEO|nr:hypothetical protein BDW02DRAFT_271760 [Decorospora gaudefroyi]
MEGSSWRSYNSIHASDNAKILLGDVYNSSPSQRDFKGNYSYSSLRLVTTFVPRPSLHDNLRKQLTHERAQDDSLCARIVVVWGLGGAGKSQLVLSYLRQHRQEYSASFWIEAGRKETIERDFLQVYRLLFDVTASGDVKTEDAVLAVKNWFVEQEGKWLFVFDGADDVDSMDGNKKVDNFVDIQHFIPDAPSVDVVITTRSSSAEGLTSLEVVKVAEMEAAEATTLFKKCSKIDCKGDDEATINEIVDELGYLALAVCLSGTYISNTPRLKLNLRKYLDEYRTRRKEILARKPNRLVHQYGESVLTTWETTFDAVAQQRAEASKLLTLLGFINFDDIFIKLFLPTSKDDDYEQNKEDGSGLAWYIEIFEEVKPDVIRMENSRSYFSIRVAAS